MASGANKKVEKIRQIVRLKQVMNRWKNMSLATTSDPNRRVPSGFLAVYVGMADRTRFVIPTRFLNLRVFVNLLDSAEEEFGYQSHGGLVLPCDVDFFRHLLRILDRDENRFGGFGLDEFSKIISDIDFESNRKMNGHGYALLVQKTRA